MGVKYDRLAFFAQEERHAELPDCTNRVQLCACLQDQHFNNAHYIYIFFLSSQHVL